jgi:hypothetical protein
MKFKGCNDSKNSQYSSNRIEFACQMLNRECNPNLCISYRRRFAKSLNKQVNIQYLVQSWLELQLQCKLLLVHSLLNYELLATSESLALHISTSLTTKTAMIDTVRF